MNKANWYILVNSLFEVNSILNWPHFYTLINASTQYGLSVNDNIPWTQQDIYVQPIQINRTDQDDPPHIIWSNCDLVFIYNNAVSKQLNSWISWVCNIDFDISTTNCYQVRQQICWGCIRYYLAQIMHLRMWQGFDVGKQCHHQFTSILQWCVPEGWGLGFV